MQGDGQRHPLHAGDAAERLHDHSLSHARQPHGSAPQLCEYSRTRLLTIGATLPVILGRTRAVARVAQPTMALVRRCFTISGLQNVTSPVVSSDHVSEGGRLWPTPPHTLSVTCPFKPENSSVHHDKMLPIPHTFLEFRDFINIQIIRKKEPGGQNGKTLHSVRKRDWRFPLIKLLLD